MTLDGTLTVSDPDSAGNLTGATVSIGTGFISGDTLNFTNQNGITGSYDAATGVLTLTGTRAWPTTRPRSNSITYSFSPSQRRSDRRRRRHQPAPSTGRSTTGRQLSNTGDQHARHGARGADGDGRRHRDVHRRRLGGRRSTAR